MREHLALRFLASRKRVRTHVLESQGSRQAAALTNRSLFDPRSIVMFALLLAVHNHEDSYARLAASVWLNDSGASHSSANTEMPWEDGRWRQRFPAIEVTCPLDGVAAVQFTGVSACGRSDSGDDWDSRCAHRLP